MATHKYGICNKPIFYLKYVLCKPAYTITKTLAG